MKANEAPEKIFLEWYRIGDKKYRDWCITPKTNDEPVEYTRTNAFMKKAKEAFCKATCNGHPPRSTCTSLGTCKEYDDFVKYMKGE